MSKIPGSSRREFLRDTAVAAAVAATRSTASAQPGGRVALVLGDSNAEAGGALERALKERGVAVTRHATVPQQVAADIVIVAEREGVTPEVFSPATSQTIARDLLKSPESLALAPQRGAGPLKLTVLGKDARGIGYALLDLADTVRYSEAPMQALRSRSAVVERPSNKIRGVNRLFVSDVEDKPWFNDREMWPAYFEMLATARFNRFSLALSIGYDFLRAVTDAYFLFPYPFLLTLPGYKVRARGLPDAERDRNLETLKYISDQAVAHGLDFQLGLWMHGYQWANSPDANYVIEGLNPENHAPYCRDALTALLKACPAISGVTFRIHGESGVAEGSYSFWAAVFEGAKRSGRPVRIDMHAKGIDFKMIDTALATGLPVSVSPKFWAEHMGMPYHQSAIREQEMPKRGRAAGDFFALSSGERSFLRYSFGDLLRAGRKYSVITRIWPGTQRLLLWGDPLWAAAYSREFAFCGMEGVELMEPLSFKGRRGSGLRGSRCGYADKSLDPRWDWQKYEYYYRLWGRKLYDPEVNPESFAGYTRKYFQTAAPAVEAALATASRVLPLITSAYGPSAANNTYWPEIYTNQPIVNPGKSNPYTDTAAPKTFGNASPFDPQIFSGVNEFVAGILKGERSGKYSPLEVAQWLDDLGGTASRQLEFAASLPSRNSPEYLRLTIDVQIQAAIGRFFGAKLRAGVLYAIFEETGSRGALEQAIVAYRGARETWSAMAARAKDVYVADITVGEHPWLRGHWLDRLAAIDQDIADMSGRLETSKVGSDPAIAAAVMEAMRRPDRGAIPGSHTSPPGFRAGQPLSLVLAVENGRNVSSARLHYRHVNQGERYQSIEMNLDAAKYRAAIPAEYTASPYHLQYYFELRESAEKAWLLPGFRETLDNRPYYVALQQLA